MSFSLADIIELILNTMRTSLQLFRMENSRKNKPDAIYNHVLNNRVLFS